jgi:hypothetical protein
LIKVTRSFSNFVSIVPQESVMKNIRMIGATLIGAAILVVAPVSLHQSPDKSVLVLLASTGECTGGHIGDARRA